MELLAFSSCLPYAQSNPCSPSKKGSRQENVESGPSYKAGPPKSQLTAPNGTLCWCDRTLLWLREKVPGTTVGLIGPMSSSVPRLVLIAWCESDLRASGESWVSVCATPGNRIAKHIVCLLPESAWGSCDLLTLCRACPSLCLSSYHCILSPASGPLVDLHTAISVHPSGPLLLE